MFKLNLCFYCIIFIVLVASGCDRVPQVAVLASEATLLAFGDSLTFGTGVTDPAKDSYPAVLARLIQRVVINAGVPGERTDQGIVRLPYLLDEYQPDLLLLCHGGNDFLQKIPEEQTIKNLTAMIQMAQDRMITVVLIGVPKAGLWLSSATLYADIATAFHLPYEEKIISHLLSTNALKSDLIHPNAKGYQKLAEAIAQLLKEAKAI